MQFHLPLLLLAGVWFARSTLAAQSFLAADGSYHSGPTDNSHIRQFSYGGIFQTETNDPDATLRYVLGVAVRHAPLDITISSVAYSVTSLDIQVRAGFLIDSFQRNYVRPIFGIYGLGGSNLITSTTPPTGASQSQAAYGWGYEFEAGINIPFGYQSAMRLTGAYRKYKFSYGGQSIAADAMAGRLGFVF